MARDVLMPQMGYDMTEGTMVRWTKKVGDKVQKGDVIAEIETDKATVEIEAFDSGTLLRTIAAPGEIVPVGQPIATLGQPGEELPAAPAKKQPDPRAPAPPPPPKGVSPSPAATAPSTPPPAARPAQPATAATPPAPPATTPPHAPPPTPGEWIRASPLARRLARELGVDISRLSGSGPGGRILRADVEAATAAAAEPEASVAASSGEEPGPRVPPLPEGARDIELSKLRRTIAQRMAGAKRTTPHFYVSVDVDAEPMLDLRAKLAAKKVKVSLNDILVKALALTAVTHPEVNAAYIGDGVRRFGRVDVGIAVATDAGLLSPALLDCGAKPLQKIAAGSRGLTQRARSGRLRAEEAGGGTITLSNLGMFGVSEFLAIINPPQALIVSVGAALDRPVVRAGKVTAGKLMTVWAAADHRVLDGADVAGFLADLKAVLEAPAPIAG